MTKKLTPERLFEIETLFNNKKWDIEREDEKFASLFNRFCSRCSLFENEKQDLIIELTNNFLKIGINDFRVLFLSAFKKIHLGKIQSAKKIFVLPLKSPNSNEPKSSSMLWYILKNYHDYSYERYFNKVSFIEDPYKVKNKHKFENYLFLFLDDFIGTGETAILTIKEILATNYDDYSLPKDTLQVITLVGQNLGISHLFNSLGVTCQAGITRNKGISESYPEEIAKEKIIIMNQIEDVLKIDADFRLGYGASESLVALEIKSPNNTFPVYWHETKTLIAPFPRHKKYANCN